MQDNHGEQILGAEMGGKHSQQVLHGHHPCPQGLGHPQKCYLAVEGPSSVSWEKEWQADHEPQNELLLARRDM